MLLNYHLLDVFTDKQMSGNPLAVVLKADNLSTDIMQKVAREFALSETAFLSEPKGGRNTAAIRIFTPRQELLFAGHPTIGSAVLLGLTRRASAIRLEEEIGVITCVMDKLSKRVGQAFFKVPKLPTYAGPAPTTALIAQSLGLNSEQIGYGDVQPAIYLAGHDFVLVPVIDETALSQIILERRDWADIYGSNDASVYVFTPNTSSKSVDYSARMFDLSLPGAEDPATGSAVAALIGLLASQLGREEGQYNFVVEQGVDMGRPSYINMQIGFAGGELVHGGIGGKAVTVGSGVLDLDWRSTPN